MPAGGSKDVDENFFRLASRLLAGLRDHPAPLACEFEMLYGIQPRLQARLLDERQVLRVLISYGEFWFPWYMRRLAERPANVWFVVRSMVGR